MKPDSISSSGVTASLHILAASVCGAALCRGWGIAPLFVLMGGVWALRYPVLLRAALTRPFMVFAGVIVLSAYLAAAGSIAQAAPVALIMLARAVTMVWAVAGLAASASIEDLAFLGSRLGLRGLGFAAGIAANSATRAGAEMRAIWWTLKMRRAGRPGLRDWRRLTLAMLARTVNRADEIATAAEARGVDPCAYDGSPVIAGPAARAWSAIAWFIAALAIAVDLLSRQ